MKSLYSVNRFCRLTNLNTGLGATLVVCIGLCLPAAVHAAAEPVASYARAYANGQLCGVGPAPNCVTTVLLNEGVFSTVTTGPFQTSAAVGSGFTPSGQVSVQTSADLATGSLRLQVAGTGLKAGQAGMANAYGFGSGVAEFGDTIFVRNQDGSPYEGAVASTLSARFDGALYGSADAGLRFIAQITVAQPGYLAAIANNDSAAAIGFIINESSTGVLQAGDSLPVAALTAAVPVGINTFEWSVRAWGGFNFQQSNADDRFAIVDLGNTIHVSLTTPLNTVFSSASGEFPGSVTSPIPETSTWALGLMGMALVLAAVRKQRAVSERALC